MKQIINYQNTPINLSSELNFKAKKPLSSFQSPGNLYISKIVMLFIDFALWFHASLEIVRNGISTINFRDTKILKEYSGKIKSFSLYNSTSKVRNYFTVNDARSNSYDEALTSILTYIDNANNLQFNPFLVFKPSSIGRYNLYKKIARGATLSRKERKEWLAVKERFHTICRKAQISPSAKIIIDAEESWVQDSIDELAIELMQEYNQKRVIVFLEIQMYRWDRLDFLLSLNKKAKRESFKVGVKLEKGKFRKKECLRARIHGYQNPLCVDEESTEANFNSALRYCMHYIDTFEIFSDVENRSDSKLVAKYMNRYQIDNNDSRIWFAQLLGSYDDISLFGR
jgi:proline dehydrogenase